MTTKKLCDIIDLYLCFCVYKFKWGNVPHETNTDNNRNGEITIEQINNNKDRNALKFEIQMAADVSVLEVI